MVVTKFHDYVNWILWRVEANVTKFTHSPYFHISFIYYTLGFNSIQPSPQFVPSKASSSFHFALSNATNEIVDTFTLVWNNGLGHIPLILELEIQQTNNHSVATLDTVRQGLHARKCFCAAPHSTSTIEIMFRRQLPFMVVTPHRWPVITKYLQLI